MELVARAWGWLKPERAPATTDGPLAEQIERSREVRERARVQLQRFDERMEEMKREGWIRVDDR